MQMLVQYPAGHVQYARVVQRDYPSSHTAFEVYAHRPPLGMRVAAEVVPDRFHVEVELLGDAMDAAIGQTVLDTAELIEGDVHGRLVLELPQGKA